VRLPKPPQASCTCSPDIDDADWQCCPLCQYDYFCENERDRMRDEYHDEMRERELENDR